MAKENNEISDIVKKCKFLLLDIEGTTTSISFVKDKLFPYAEENVKGFLESHWENEDVKGAVAALRKQAAEDLEKSVEGFVAIPGEDASKDEQVEGLVSNVKWQMSADRKAGPLKQLQGLIWALGYDKGDIKGHVYDDVSPALELWRATEGQKVYIYSSGSVQAQKLLFSKSLAGDLLPLIEGHFDTAVGAKQEAASYKAIVEKIGCQPEEILFLTDIAKEAEAARASGLQAALVSRGGNAPLPAEATASFPVLHSFEQLTLTNKRKPDPQVEEVPAKVPKTDVQGDVKTTETENGTAKANGNTDAMETAPVVEKPAEPETMEVEETPDVKVAVNKDAVRPVDEPAKVEDITEKDVPMDEAAAAPAVAKPIAPVASEAVSTDIKQVKVIPTPADKEFPDAKGVKASAEGSTKVVSSAGVEKPKAAPKKVEAVAKNKVEMVDAATLTEGFVEVAKIVNKIPKVDKVDVATETAIVVEPFKKSSPKAKKNVEVPLVKEKKKTPDESPVIKPILAKDAKDALVAKKIDETDKTPASITQNVEATSTSDVVDSSEMEAVSADSTSANSPTAAVKTEEAPAIESKSAGSVVGETSEACPKESNDMKATSVDGSIVVEADHLQNGVEKATDKLEEVAIETVVEEVNDPSDALPACDVKPVVEEVGEKTDPKETEEMETEATVSAENVETATEPKGPAKKPQENVFIEVKDVTEDKEQLAEVTDIIDDVVPIVEEPSQLEEIEKLQNAGDVLEKECDEILSKVQDVTNLDYIPVKPLHTIAEEMETDNIDSNDMVERILDTEMELSMKPEDIDLNTVQEIEPKTDACEKISQVEQGTEKASETSKVEVNTEEKMEESCDTEMVPENQNDDKAEPEIDIVAAKEVKAIAEVMETEVVPEAKIESDINVEAEESAKPEIKSDSEAPIAVEPLTKTDETEAKPGNNESDKASVGVAQETKETSGSQDVEMDDATATKVNGKTNGNIVKLNGNASKDDDLESRLTAQNVKEKVNGSNGDSADSEKGQGDNKVEAEIPDIKVKTVTDEAPTPKEQPVEA